MTIVLRCANCAEELHYSFAAQICIALRTVPNQSTIGTTERTALWVQCWTLFVYAVSLYMIVFMVLISYVALSAGR